MVNLELFVPQIIKRDVVTTEERQHVSELKDLNRQELRRVKYIANRAHRLWQRTFEAQWKQDDASAGDAIRKVDGVQMSPDDTPVRWKSFDAHDNGDQTTLARLQRANAPYIRTTEDGQVQVNIVDPRVPMRDTPRAQRESSLKSAAIAYKALQEQLHGGNATIGELSNPSSPVGVKFLRTVSSLIHEAWKVGNISPQFIKKLLRGDHSDLTPEEQGLVNQTADYGKLGIWEKAKDGIYVEAALNEASTYIGGLLPFHRRSAIPDIRMNATPAEEKKSK